MEGAEPPSQALTFNERSLFTVASSKGHPSRSDHSIHYKPKKTPVTHRGLFLCHFIPVLFRVVNRVYIKSDVGGFVPHHMVPFDFAHRAGLGGDVVGT